jgi:hypothetical protein
LGSPADIAAWIAERKRNYPTKARIQAKKKEEEARRLATLRALVESSRGSKKDQNTDGTPKGPKISKRQKAFEKHLAKAEQLRKELEESRNDSQPSNKFNLGSDYDSTDEDSVDSASSVESSSDESGSDDDRNQASDAESSDGPPDEESIEKLHEDKKPNTPAALPVSSSAPAQAPANKPKPLCHHFQQGKRCPRGKRCIYRHEKPASAAKGRVSIHSRVSVAYTQMKLIR